MNAKLYINYQEVELSKKDLIVLSLGVNRLTDIQTRQGYYSNTFKLPRTATNLEIFGHPDQLNTTDTKRYERLVAWIESDGVQVVYGFAQLKTTQGELEVVVKGGNSDWIQLLKDKKLSDLNLRDLDHQHDSTTVQANRFNDYTSGFVYPDIDYGQLQGDKDENALWYYFKPSVFAKRIFEQCFTDIGYSLDNPTLDVDERFLKMVVPYSNKERLHSNEWEDALKFKVNIDSQATTTANYKKVELLSIDYDNGGNIDLTDNHYQPNELINSQTFRLNLTYTVGTYTSFANIKIGVSTVETTFASASDVIELIDETQTSTGTFTTTVDFEYHYHNKPIHIFALVDNNTITIDSGTWEVLTVDKKVLRGSEWNVAINLPDMLQTDFVKHIINSFCGIISPQIGSNTLQISTFDQVPTKTPEDWSDKVDISEDALISYEYGDFKQSNVLEYDINKDDKYLKETPELGKFTIEHTRVDNGIKKLYKSPFSLVAVGKTYQEELTKALIDHNEAESNYTELFIRPSMTITEITSTGQVTVSAAHNLFPGVGVHLTNINAALYEGGFFPNTVFFADDRVFVVSDIISSTQFQLQGEFNGDTVTAGTIYCGVMVDINDRTFINVIDSNEIQPEDEVTFYGTDGSSEINGESINGMTVFCGEALSNRCFAIQRKTPYTFDFEYESVEATNSQSITEGEVRIIKATENVDAAPRIGYHNVSTNASNAITLFGETTETQVSEVTYEQLTWETLVANYWVTLKSIIETPQMVKCLIRLSAMDVNQIDFTTPKYIDKFGCLFYLSYVDQFKTNQIDSTDVELVKLP